MNKETYIFIGRSGCGKGTQASLLINEFKNQGKVTDKLPMFYIETGQRFRNFVKNTGYSSRLAKEIMDQAGRQPDFLAVWMWSHLLVENVIGDEHIIFDGTPRSLIEAEVLDTALKFYGRNKPIVVHIKVSNDWSKERLLSRGRTDDVKITDIEHRLAWFEHDVLPAVEYYRSNPDYQFIEVNGEQSIDEVHADLMRALNQ